MTRFVWWFIQIVVVVILIYSLFFGNLLFLNPIKLGMRNRKSERATVYTRNLYKLSPVFNFVDDYIKEAEEFYGIKYKGKISIYVAETKEEFQRYMPPWVKNGNDLGGYTLLIGNVIYINPTVINDKHYNQEEFLKHELIHELIVQNSAFLNSIIIENQHWLAEGLATYFGGPHYYNENEFLSLIKNKKLIYEERSYTLFTNLDSNDPTFNSSLYTYFVEFLIDKYSQTRFKEFMTKYLQSPGNYKVIFFEVYNKRFKLVVDEFLREYQS